MSDLLFPQTAVDSLERRGLRDHVYDRVLDVLLGPGVEPGTRLSIDAVARQLGVSPTPVREALIELERTGLVTRVANKGYRVAPPLQAEQLDALFDARSVLEGGAARLAALHTDSMVEVLTEALDQHERIARELRGAQGADAGGSSSDAHHSPMSVDRIRQYFAVDWRFHHLVFEGAKNPFLLDMSDAISTRVHRMRQTLKTGVHDADEAIAEHRRIIAAFGEGPDAAEAAMREHIERVRERSRRDSEG